MKKVMSNRLTIQNIMNINQACQTYMLNDFYNSHFGEDRDLYWIYFECRTDDGIKIKECRVHIDRVIHTNNPASTRYVRISFNTNKVVDGMTDPLAHTRRFNMPISALKNYVSLLSEIMMMVTEETYIPRGIYNLDTNE